MREKNRARLIESIQKNVWEITIIPEIRSDKQGVIWMGKGEKSVAIIHFLKTAIVFWGSALDQWIRGNQKNPMQICPKQGDKKPKSRNVPIAPYPFSPRTWLDIETLAEAKRVESVPQPGW